MRFSALVAVVFVTVASAATSGVSRIALRDLENRLFEAKRENAACECVSTSCFRWFEIGRQGLMRDSAAPSLGAQVLHAAPTAAVQVPSAALRPDGIQ
jgi:hypothetical protein